MSDGADIVARLRHMARLLGFDLPVLLNEAADEIDRLRSNNCLWNAETERKAVAFEGERLRKALEGIAEFCSADATKLGAIDRLTSIQNTARQALRLVG
jgi:hypothetical protein